MGEEQTLSGPSQQRVTIASMGLSDYILDLLAALLNNFAMIQRPLLPLCYDQAHRILGACVVAAT